MDGAEMTNAEMTNMMRSTGTIHSESVLDAFQAIDRARFLMDGASPDELEDAYLDMPLRQACTHPSTVPRCAPR